MIFRQLFDAETSTFTYFLADEKTREAAIIDTVIEQHDRDIRLFHELDIFPKYILETHVHADHITGAKKLRTVFPEAKIGYSQTLILPCADLHLSHKEELFLGTEKIVVFFTPGHTDGDLSFLAGDRLFSGDTLFIRGAGRTDFQSGDAGKQYDSITKTLFALPDTTMVFPGHDYAGMTMSTIAEEKKYNRRVANISREEFIANEKKMHRDPPKKIQSALPANMECGLQ